MRAAARGELKLRFKSLFVILVNRIRREEWNDSHFSLFNMKLQICQAKY